MQPEQEQQLARRIVARLDEGLERLDAGTRERLATVRRAALARYQEAPALGLAGGLVQCALVDRDGQFLHERLAGTRIAMSEGAASVAPGTTSSRSRP